MSGILITKATEAKAIATIWNMAAESLDPESYCALEDILKTLCATRHIDNEAMADEHIVLSGRRTHRSDCATSNSPALIPSPCDCCFPLPPTTGDTK